jgi:hypothetical protein
MGRRGPERQEAEFRVQGSTAGAARPRLRSILELVWTAGGLAPVVQAARRRGDGASSRKSFQ